MESLIEQFTFFAELPAWISWGSVAAVLLILGFTGAPLWIWAAAGLVALAGFGAPVWLVTTYIVLAVIFNVKPIRRSPCSPARL